MTKPVHTTPPPDAAARRGAPPVLTYSVEHLPSFNAAFYNGARAELSKVAEITVPPREARAFEVLAGQFFRVVSVEGPQIGDLNLWNAHDLTERFYSGKTRALHATHLSTSDRLWSTFPSLRPMATITHDTLDWYGWDEDVDNPRWRLLRHRSKRKFTRSGDARCWTPPWVSRNAGDLTMTSKLSGKVALVTAGSAGIGLGVAKRFAEEGARVFITGRRQSELDKAVTAIGGGATAVQGDISNLDDLDRIYARIKPKAGHIDVLAVNAGYYEFGRFGEITEEHFDKTLNTNVRGLLFTVQKALPLLTEGASVILTGSIASIKGFPSLSVYNASKAAVRSFARSWIADLKGRGIRINVLSPGHVETPGLSNLITLEQKAEAVAPVPLGRIGTPDDLGKAAVFLASDDSAYVTGTELFVDGGVAQI